MAAITMPGLIPGLTRIKTLLNVMGNPQDAYPSVHVAGTNGKGSVTLIIAAVLQHAGYRVGRFTSPHIHSYRERFSINGENIDAALLKDYLEQIKQDLITITEPSFTGVTEFEMLTALAFQYFKDNQVDIAVLETGMGGLYDSTNVVHPLLSVITGVDYDHQAYLGNSLEEIAFNKAGIIKPEIPVVVGMMDNAAYRVIENIAQKKQAPIYNAENCLVKRHGSPSNSGQTVSIKYADFDIEQVKLSLLGDFQLNNLAVATTALLVLKERGYNITAEHISQVLPHLHNPSRMEFISYDPPIILDVAHNPQAARALKQSLKSVFPDKQGVLVCGILDDKDSRIILRELGKNCRACVITKPESERGENWLNAAKQWQDLYKNKKLLVKEDIAGAVKAGLDLLKPGEYLLVAGSFYIMDKARTYLMTNRAEL